MQWLFMQHVSDITIDSEIDIPGTKIIIIIMVIFMCYFSGELIALS